MLGAGIALYFALPAMPGDWLLPTVAMALLGVLFAASRVLSYRWVLIAAALLLSGVGLADLAARYDGTAMLARNSGARAVTGFVRDIEPQEEGVRIVLETTSIEKMDASQTPKRVRLAYRLKDSPPAIGATVVCPAKLMAVSPPVLPGGYDFRRHNYFEHIGATGFVVKACDVLTPAQERGSLTQLMAEGRLRLRTAIAAVLQGDEAAIAEALLTGVQQGITKETMTSMRVSGLVHILSVSGLHIGLAAGIVFFALRALLALIPFVALRWPIKKLAAVAALLSALAYTLLVGAPIPAVRSLLMTGLVLLAVILDRQALSLRVVAVAAMGVLIAYPSSILSPSFQMSFAAITAIISLIESTESWQRAWLIDRGWLTRAIVFIVATAATSMAATLATLPFTYYHFQQLNVYGVLANMLAMPLASLWLMPLVVITFVAIPFGFQHYPLVMLGEGVRWLVAIADGVSALPGADWRAPYMPDTALVFMVMGGAWLLLWRARWRWWGVVPILAAVVLGILAPLPQALVSDDGRMAMLRQGQGDYILVANKQMRADNFVVEQWSRYLGVRSVKDAEGSPLCDAAVCANDVVALIRDPNAMPRWCNSTDKVILLPSAAAGQYCGVAVDMWALYRHGAAVVDGAGVVHTVASSVGAWPWSRYDEKGHR